MIKKSPVAVSHKTDSTESETGTAGDSRKGRKVVPAEIAALAITPEDAVSAPIEQAPEAEKEFSLANGQAGQDLHALDALAEVERAGPAAPSEEPRSTQPQSGRAVMPIGVVDELAPERIIGWAWYRSRPDEPIDVQIMVDDVLVREVRADQFRPELEGRAGNGCHGFVVHDPATHMPPGRYSVRVLRATDGLELEGSPGWVTQPEAGPRLGVAEEIPGVPAEIPRVAAEIPGVAAEIPGVAAEIPGVAAEIPGVAAEIPAGAPTPAPTFPPARPSVPRIGNIDFIDHDQISGWAWDPANPHEPIDIEILDGDVVVLTVRADQFRTDLLEGKIGDGFHGFQLRNMGGALPLSRHLVRVRRASDGLDLPGSPSWITRPGLDSHSLEFMERAVSSAITVATSAEDLAQPLSALLNLLNDLVNVHDGLARASADAGSVAAIHVADDLNLTGRTRELINQLRYSHPPLWFEPAANPEVSIVIPVFNKFAYTYDCLRSILAAPPERNFEIIIVDDCSEDETLFASLVLTGAVRVLRNARNLGFVGSCNAGADAAKGRYLFFLNNDTLVKPGWLDELVETFEQLPNIGIAGSKLLFPDGTLQEVGGIIWRLGDGWNWGRGRDPSELAFSYLRDADYVSGAALMIPRDLFQDLGGFDQLFAPAYYEDSDLCFRVRARGRRVVVQPASEIVHLEGVSAGTDPAGTGMKRYQVINHAKFYRRWKDVLITHRLNGQEPELEAERLVHKRAYFIDDTVPTPDQDAGSNAAIDHMRLLGELGYKVTFLAADNMAKIDPYTGNLQKLGIECLYYPTYWSVEEVFRKAKQKPDLVYLHRYTNASKYATMVRRYFPDCRIVYCVADLHFLRMERQAAIEGSPGATAAAAAQRRTELAAVQTVDYVIVHSPVEAALLREADPRLAIGVVPWTVRPRPTPLAFEERAGTAFVGGFGHPPNGDAVQYLINEILPLLRRQAPDCITYLIGSKMPEKIMGMNLPNLAPLGFVPVLADILHKLRCTIVPLRYGAGIKGKVLESFAHGLPCVMSEVAAEGLELPEELAWLVARSPEEFAAKVARLHSDAAFNDRLSQAGLRYIAERNSTDVVKQALQAAVSADAEALAVAL